MKLRIKSSLNPAIFRGEKYDRIVAGSIWEVNGEKWEHQYIEWKVESSKAGKVYTVRETPSGKRTCSCDGFHYRRQCRHINEVK